MNISSRVTPIIVPLDKTAGFDPATYPGEKLDWSVVVTECSAIPIQLKKGRRLGQSAVFIDPKNGEESAPSLNKFLLQNNAAQMDRRFPVVGIGMNSDPQVMAAKFESYQQKSGKQLNRVFPMFRATLTGIQLGHLPKPSLNGFFAATPFSDALSDDLELEATVSFLDEFQLGAVDLTEPNYERIFVRSEAFRVRVHTTRETELSADFPTEHSASSFGESLSGFYIYRSKRGLLTLDGESPAAFDPSQDSLFEKLNQRIPGFSNLRQQLIGETPEPGDLNAEIAHAAIRQSAEDLIRDAGLRLANTDFLDDLAPDDAGSSISPRYGEIDSYWGEEYESESLAVLPTNAGENSFRTVPFVSLTRKVLEELDIPARRGVVKLSVCSGLSGCAPTSMLVELRIEKTDDEQHHGSYIRVDQIARNALGVEIGERVTVVGVEAPTILRHRHVVTRWQAADISVVEQDACILDVTAMKLLGVEDGDKVVLTGLPVAGGRINSLPLRVFAAEDKIQLRRNLDGGGLESRFPGTDQVLGVYPDVPWIFIDFDAAAQINVLSPKLSPVLVRAGQVSLLSREARELVLVLTLAVVGSFNFFAEAGKADSKLLAEQYLSYGLVTIGIVVLTGLMVLWWRIRSRLGMPLLPMPWLRGLSKIRKVFQISN